MAVVIDDRQIPGETMVKLDRLIVLKQKILCNKDVFHPKSLGKLIVGRWTPPAAGVAPINRSPTKIAIFHQMAAQL
jgi:hypothetical protein